MIGITSCGYHIPFCRLERSKFGQAWDRRGGKAERAWLSTSNLPG